MSFARLIREIGRPASSLSSAEAEQLFAAILDGGVPELELGAILLALRLRGEQRDELHGFLAAAEARINTLQPPAGRPLPVVLPSYNGARKGANLTPLLALLLQRFGVPVLVHGTLEGYGRVTSARIFRELNLLPAASLIEAQRQLDAQGLCFLPLPALFPALSDVLQLRMRLGVRNVAHSLVKMLNPFRAQAVLVTAATHPGYLDAMRETLCRRTQTALLLRASEGEPYANPLRRPRIELIRHGDCALLFEAEHDSLKTLPRLPADISAVTTAAWTREVLAGRLPTPLPLSHQLAACLYASGVARDPHEAKALAVVETRNVAPV